MPGSQGTDKDRIVPMFGRESHVVRKGSGDPQIDAPSRSLLAQKIGFHLDIAVSEKENLDAFPSAAQVR